jgi:MFS transporter, FSR family, fosmidomycin resistance protein
MEEEEGSELTLRALTVKRPTIPPAVFALSGMHLVNDIFGNIYAPLLPIFILRLDLSLATAGVLAMALQVAGSIAQLVFGPLADRWRPRLLAVTGPVVTVVALSLAGLATSPLMLGVILVVGSLGSAAFHPTAAALIHRVGGDRRGTAMSVHVTGGAIGNGIAPTIFSAWAQYVGIAWTPLLALPGVAVLAGLRRNVPDIRPDHRIGGAGFAALRPYARPLGLLWLVVVVRTVVAIGLSVFLPVLMTTRGFSVAEAGLAVTGYLIAGSLGGLVGGPAADRLGARRVIAGSLALSAPLLAGALWLPGLAALPVLMAGGFFLGSTLPVNIAYAHAIAPVATGAVSSLMLGAAWGVGGMAVPLVGVAGDAVGIAIALQGLAILPLVGALLTLALPAGETQEAEPVET